MEANTRLTKNLTALTAAYNKLLTAMPRATTAATPSSAAATPMPATARKCTTGSRCPTNPNSYCWMHGYCIKIGHSSATCTQRFEGHKPAATHANPMGGSTAGNCTTS